MNIDVNIEQNVEHQPQVPPVATTPPQQHATTPVRQQQHRQLQSAAESDVFSDDDNENYDSPFTSPTTASYQASTVQTTSAENTSTSIAEGRPRRNVGPPVRYKSYNWWPY